MLYSIKNDPILSHEYINSYVSDFDIYSYYMGCRFKLNSIFNSPLRQDKTPSFGIIQNPEGRLIYNDFGNSDTGNAITFVQKKLNLSSYKEALAQIYCDLILNQKEISDSFTNITKLEKKADSVIEVIRQPFNTTDLKYWGQYHITKDILKKYEVDPIKYLIVNGIVHWQYTKENPMYNYQNYDKRKIYRPLADKRNKWFGSMTKNYVFGHKQLPLTGSLLIITKSLKDVMCLRSFGYLAVSPPSEGSLMPKQAIENYKVRFDKIIVLYDNDEQGIKSAKRMKDTYNIDNIIIPIESETKDISDYCYKYGADQTSILLKQIIDGQKIEA